MFDRTKRDSPVTSTPTETTTTDAELLASTGGDPARLAHVLRTLPPEHRAHVLAAAHRVLGNHAVHQALEPHRSQATPGMVMTASIGKLLDGSTRLTPAIESLIHAMQRGVRIADKPGDTHAGPVGLAGLEAVFTDHHNQPRLHALLHGEPPLAWLRRHETAVIATRDPGTTATRDADEIVHELATFLRTHHGARALLDEIGTGRYELVAHVARELGRPEHASLRGRWGAFVSGKASGINPANHPNRPVIGALRALEHAGGSAVLEGYSTLGDDPHPWRHIDRRLAQDKAGVEMLREHYVAHPGLAVGVDEARLVPELAELNQLDDWRSHDGRTIEQVDALSPPEATALHAQFHAFAHLPADPAELLVALKHRHAILAARRAQLHQVYLHRIAAVSNRAERELGGEAAIGSWVSRFHGGEASDKSEIDALHLGRKR